MTIAIIIITSVIAIYLAFRLYTKGESLDETKVLNNRLELMNLAYKDLSHGRINKDLYRMFGFVFHPDFRNIWDYVPPERQEYTKQMYILDSNFWKSYKITPDFAIPAEMVYELYKAYASQYLNDYLKNQHCSEANISSQTKEYQY